MDTKKLRIALKSCNMNLAPHLWFGSIPVTIYNDKHKAGGRRLKIAFATHIFNDTQRQQQQLEKAIRAQFGPRIVKMQFVKNRNSYIADKSLCITLTK